MVNPTPVINPVDVIAPEPIVCPVAVIAPVVVNPTPVINPVDVIAAELMVCPVASIAPVVVNPVDVIAPEPMEPVTVNPLSVVAPLTSKVPSISVFSPTNKFFLIPTPPATFNAPVVDELLSVAEDNIMSFVAVTLPSDAILNLSALLIFILIPVLPSTVIAPVVVVKLEAASASNDIDPVVSAIIPPVPAFTSNVVVPVELPTVIVLADVPVPRLIAPLFELLPMFIAPLDELIDKALPLSISSIVFAFNFIPPNVEVNAIALSAVPLLLLIVIVSVEPLSVVNSIAFAVLSLEIRAT